MKRKCLILICAASLLLTACESDHSSGVNVFSTGSVAARPPAQSTESSRESAASTVGTTSMTSTASTTGTVSSDSAPQSVVESSGESVASGASEASEPPENNIQTIVYSYDPKNACTVTFDGFSVIVRGKIADLMTNVACDYPELSVGRSSNGDEAVFTLTPKDTRLDEGFGKFYIIDKNNNWNYMFLEVTANGLFLPDTSSLVRNNDNVVNSAQTAAAGKTLRYITRDGKSDKAADVLAEIKRISDEICEGINSDYEKLRAITYWVSDNIYYDHPAYNKGIPQECLSLEYMLNNRSSVCGGYANMTAALCAAQGIRCLNITGSAVNVGCFNEGYAGEFHEWNVAKIDGRYIIVDSGWNSFNHFNNSGRFQYEPIGYKYFDIGEEVFALDHKAATAEYRDFWEAVEE